MSNKAVTTLALTLLLLLLQWPLWFGKGSWWEARKLQGQLNSQEQENTGKAERNTRLADSVKDLEDGKTVAESQARQELGMIRNDEVFVQVTPGAKRPVASASAAPAAASAARPSASAR